jgi:hypothetical protein
MVGVLALAFEQHVGLADGVGLGVDLLTVEVAGDLKSSFLRNSCERLLGDGQHAAGAAGAVVEQVTTGFELVLYRQQDKVRHQPHGVAWRPVLARFLVVLLIEFADEFLEHRAHRVVVDAGWREVDLGVDELADERAKCVGLRECRELVAKCEIVEDVLNVGREPVEVVSEVGKELLLAAAGLEIP